MSDRTTATLSTLMSGLTIRGVECVLHFSRPAPVRPLATATIRGLAGHLLTSTHPACVGRWFKPGHQNHLPSAYLFEALTHEFALSDCLAISIRTWDPPEELLPAFVDALKQARGYPFGESGASIEGVSFGQIEGLKFEQTHRGIPQAMLEFLTPVRLKASGRWLGKEDITVGHLMEAAVRRLDVLSGHYGNGSTLDAPALLASASKVRETARALRWISPWRRSSSQGTDIELSGLIGQVQFTGIPGELVDLLNAVALFHIGHKTAEGCGQFRLVG
jgi:CRISPR-associated endoribonuclease Cas6